MNNGMILHNILIIKQTTLSTITVNKYNGFVSSFNNVQIRHISDDEHLKNERERNEIMVADYLSLKQEKKELYQDYIDLKAEISKKEQGLRGEVQEFISETEKSISPLTNFQKQLIKKEIKQVSDNNKECTKQVKTLDKESDTCYAESTSTRSSFESVDCDTERKMLDVKAELSDSSKVSKDYISQIFGSNKNVSDYTKKNLGVMGGNIDIHADSLNEKLDNQEDTLNKYDVIKQDYKAAETHIQDFKNLEQQYMSLRGETTRSRSSSVDTTIAISDIPKAVNEGKISDSEQKSLDSSTNKENRDNLNKEGFFGFSTPTLSLNKNKDVKNEGSPQNNSDKTETNTQEQNTSNDTKEETNISKETTGLISLGAVAEAVSNISNTGLF